MSDEKDFKSLSPFFDKDVIEKAISKRAGKGRLPPLNPKGKFHRRMIYMGSSYSDWGGEGLPLEGLALWLKADEITGLVDNNPVATWNDSSGNNNHATQAAEADRPVYKPGIVNGLPVVRFDGVSDFLESPYSASDDVNTTNQSIFAVYRTNSTATPQIVVWQGEANANGYGPEFEMHIQITDGFLAPNFVGAIVGGQNAQQGSAISTTDTLNFHILTGVFGDLRSVPEIQAFLDGVAGPATVSPGGDEIVNWIGSTRLGRPGLATRFFSGDIAEVLIYEANMAAKRASVEKYLKSKYNL